MKRRTCAPAPGAGSPHSSDDDDDGRFRLEGPPGSLDLSTRGTRVPGRQSATAPPPQRRRRTGTGAALCRTSSASSSGAGGGGGSKGGYKPPRKIGEAEKEEEAEELPEELQGLDPKLVEMISNEVVHTQLSVTWDDIAGLEFAKQSVKEAVIWPILRPDLFTGLRRVPRGLLLFGPPGTGKTLIGKAIAKESGATFFSISASSLMSKWVGEGERLVRTLFKVAEYREPSVVFIDEVDSLLCQRNEKDMEASRRIKTEFLVQLDGVGTASEARVLVVGATNRPQELDEAARRRFVKRLYIPLPNEDGRSALVRRLLCSNETSLSEEEVQELVKRTAGYSGADIQNLCQEAALGPIRELTGVKDISSVDPSDVREISFRHFEGAFRVVRPSVAPSEVEGYLEWDRMFGSMK